MPWWAIIYLVLFAAVTVAGAVLCLRDDGVSCRRVCDLIAPVIFSYFFAAFWMPQIRSILGFLAPILFLAAIGCEVYSWPTDRRETNADVELSQNEKRLGKTLISVFALPFYGIAAVAVFRDYLRA